MLRFTRRAGALLLGAGMLALPAFVTLSAQSTSSAAGMKEDKPGQLALAKVTPDAARKIALARVPKGTISEEGIEKEKGKLLYSFDIKVPGKRGVEEILVDALTGTVISHEHETPKQEADEARKDSINLKAGATKGIKPRNPPR